VLTELFVEEAEELATVLESAVDELGVDDAASVDELGADDAAAVDEAGRHGGRADQVEPPGPERLYDRVTVAVGPFRAVDDIEALLPVVPASLAVLLGQTPERPATPESLDEPDEPLDQLVAGSLGNCCSTPATSVAISCCCAPGS
jgi:hypothetical protein